MPMYVVCRHPGTMHTELHAGFRVYEGTLVFSTVWFVCGYFDYFWKLYSFKLKVSDFYL